MHTEIVSPDMKNCNSNMGYGKMIFLYYFNHITVWNFIYIHGLISKLFQIKIKLWMSIPHLSK